MTVRGRNVWTFPPASPHPSTAAGASQYCFHIWPLTDLRNQSRVPRNANVRFHRENASVSQNDCFPHKETNWIRIHLVAAGTESMIETEYANSKDLGVFSEINQKKERKKRSPCVFIPALFSFFLFLFFSRSPCVVLERTFWGPAFLIRCDVCTRGPWQQEAGRAELAQCPQMLKIASVSELLSAYGTHLMHVCVCKTSPNVSRT